MCRKTSLIITSRYFSDLSFSLGVAKEFVVPKIKTVSDAACAKQIKIIMLNNPEKTV